MGKDTDKMYITHSEWQTLDFGHGGYKARKTGKEFKRLPFHCHIVPWIKKHGTNPVTGEKLEAKDLIPLNFHKNQDGQYHDPVTYKVFTESTHIIAIDVSGNVYAAETIEELNAKTKCWRDLLTEEPFTRKNIITIQV
ncbi:Peptidyl-prolyl cis-trans isomerase cyp8 [Irineochytrium annulatum]|nr:Peptidyl-prolyl cis-trans isomerase cyp8 [Irineochytrium annulatum]